jgi:hypothetical protein
MIAFEVALVLVIGVIVVSGLVTLAKPITEAASERIKFKYREMGSESEKMLKDKVNILESELIAVKEQVRALQETVDYVSKEVESQSGEAIKIKQNQS